ncbi:MAG: ATP phosphoribosyltransferase regulatory subunit [Planctomycetes bacterium]|nr:ATP phosphoribosyltransferase regulatory subunit [Planctomycetota bacterium]
MNDARSILGEHLSLPYGVKDVLGGELVRRRRVERVLEQCFEEAGCTPIQTPTFEHYEVFARGASPQALRRAYRFSDGDEDLVLRPDPTSAVARVVATALRDEPLPLRLAYVCPVFRREEPHGGHFREFHQAGIEWIGERGTDVEVAVLDLALRCLERIGVSRALVQLGSSAVPRALFGPRLEGPHGQRLLAALDRRSAPALDELERDGALDRAALRDARTLLELSGGVEVFEAARELQGYAAARAALDHLELVFRSLPASRARIDLCATLAMEYYTGLIFRVYAPGQGFELGGGGRYDRLLARFGRDLPAVGFGLEIERLLPVAHLP